MIPGNDSSTRTRTACSVVCFNEAKIAALRASLPAEASLASAAARHKALGHGARIAILSVLAAEPCCVCDLANVLDMPLSTLSQHLKTLRSAGLVHSRQEGKFVIYSAADEAHSTLELAAAGRSRA